MNKAGEQRICENSEHSYSGGVDEAEEGREGKDRLKEDEGERKGKGEGVEGEKKKDRIVSEREIIKEELMSV